MSNIIDPTEIKLGDKVALSDRYGKLIDNEEFEIGHIFTVAGIKPRSYSRLEEAKVTKTDAVLLLEETGTQEFGYEWFDKAPPESSIPTLKFNEGDRVRVVSSHSNPRYAQRFGTIVEANPDRDGAPYLIQFDGDNGPTGGRWSDDFIVSAGPVPANEVTIDFSIDRYRTAREYAARAIGVKMKEEHQRTLRAAARGEKVNILALNGALADAYRQNATRYGQSPQRRQGATELSHLQYIVQGTLSNVLQGLPPVDPGARSPRIKELEVELAKVRAERANLAQERSTLTQAASGERRRLCAEINEYEAAVVAATAELEKITAARDTALRVLAYALGKIDEDLDRERVLGFWDAVEPGFRHDFDPQN